MVLDSEIRVTLQRIENALQHQMELSDFRNFMLAKSYLEENQIATAMQFLKRIEYSGPNANRVIIQSLFIRALILVHELQFTDALALLVRIRKLNITDEKLLEDISTLIRDIKIQQQASAMYETAKGREEVENFRQSTLTYLQHYLNTSKELVRK
jgi:tetratricopeptide (TPR) repeat protein